MYKKYLNSALYTPCREILTRIIVMKILIVFFLLCFIQSGASTGLAQEVSLNVQNMPLKQVLYQLTKQTGYNFIADGRDLNRVGTISLDVKNETLERVLQKCFDQTKYQFLFNDYKTVIIKPRKDGRVRARGIQDEESEVQQRVISGRIQNTQGAAIPGVTIMIKGTQQGSTSGADGAYQLTLSSGGKTDLLFSAVGYISREIAVTDQQILDVVLEEQVSDLDEVVVVGYGTVRKKDLTGAVGVISGSKIQNNAVPTVGHGLQGKIAGLQITQTSGAPNADVSIRIRGTGTFGANANPLVVVDGVITSMGLADIDPSNIEDITILKDASSAAIYGSRGANGVVMVSTKRGKAGVSSVDVQSYYGVDQVVNQIDVVDATTYAEMVNDYYVNQGKDAPYDNPGSFGKGTNWQDQIFRSAAKHNHSISFTGGADKNQYALTTSYFKGTGTVVNSEFDRVNFRINNDIQPIDRLKLGSSLGLSYGETNQGNPQGAISSALIYAPNVVPYNEDGSYGIADRVGQPTTMTQPLVNAYERHNKEIRLRALGNLFAEYELFQGFKFRTNLGLEYNNFDGKYFTPAYNFGLGNMNGSAFLDKNQNSNKNFLIDNIFSYVNTFGEHHFDAMAGYTFQYEKYEFVNAYRDGFPRNDSYLQVLDAGTSNDRARGNYTEWALQSYLGRVNYSYANRYLFTSSLRIDQTSRIASINRTGYFPSFSLGWVLSEEDFMKDQLRAINFVKLRGGYGVLGNQDIGLYPYQSIVNSSLYYSLGLAQNVHQGAIPTSFANPNIRWERGSTTNAGLEVNMFESKLGVILDYYIRNTTDILVQVPLPTLSGLEGNPYQNAASLRNKGFELTLNYIDGNMDKDFSYNVGFNLSINDNKVTKLNKGAEIVFAQSRIEQGYEMNEFFGYIHDGIFQTAEEVASAPTQPNAQPGDIRFRDLDGNNIIDDRDRTYIGHTLPKYTFGFNGGIQYKKFDLAVSLNGVFRWDGPISSPGFAITRGAEQTSAMYDNRWVGAGTSNWVPRLVGGDPNSNSRFSSFWLRSRDYVRIQNVQLGYDLGSAIINNIGLRKFRIYAAAQNLATFTKWPGYDPELGTNIYPIPRSVFFGINIGF